MLATSWPLSIMSAAADGVGLGVELLAVALEPRLRVELAQVVLGDREHAAGAAGRVESVRTMPGLVRARRRPR